MELLHRRCCGLDVHKDTVVACLRLVSNGKVTTEVRTFRTITADLLKLSEWLAANDCTHVAMEATGVYWKPVWHILDDGEFVLVLANAAHVKNVPGRKTDVNDAMWLAELLAHGLIRASFVPDQTTQDPKKAIIAVAASILTAIYHMLKDGTMYQDLGADHFNRRSTDRQKTRLVKRLADLGYAVELKPLAARAALVAPPARGVCGTVRAS